MSLTFESKICLECRQDRSLKNTFKDIEIRIDDFPAYLRNKISIVISAT
jgi:hypothetical protein